MSPKQEQRLHRHTVKAAVRASKKLDHPLTDAELMRLKVQVMPGPLRAALIVAGFILIIFAFTAWPDASTLARWGEGISGTVLIGFGLVGVRRTVSVIVDAVGEIGAQAFIEGIFGVIGNLAD